MKTQILKNSLKSQRVLVLCIYALAFVLMTWSFNSRADVVRAPAKAAKKTANKDTSVIISTSMGDIKVKLNAEKAPITTENFLKYVDKKHYDGTIFHRVIKDFMIQGGGFTPDMKEKDTMAPIKNEANNKLSNKRGTIAMARTNDVNSATAQFFINVENNERLDYKSDAQYGYAVFGEVTEGMDVVDKIRQVRTVTKGAYDDVPAQTVTINSIQRGK
jgi:cyclophilin family peptidyl-prolyl cis-trans isomerase